MKKIIILLLIPILCCCTSQYKKPESGPTSFLRLTTDFIPANSIESIWLHTYEEKGCIKPVAMGVLGKSTMLLSQHHEPVGMVGSKRVADPIMVESIIPSDRPFTVLFTFQTNGTTQGSTQSCAIPVTFLPEEGRSYEAIYDLNSRHCSVQIFDLVEHAGNVSKSPVKIKTEKSACGMWSL